MIRHRPHGLGHPYRLEADQLVPAQPVAGEPIEFRATTHRRVEQLEVEIDVDGATRRRQAQRLDGTDASRVGPGHLAAAAARAIGRGRVAWSVWIDPLPAGSQVRYRFIAGDRTTRRFSFVVAGWGAEGGIVELIPADRSDRLVPGSVVWLRAGDATHRARLALRLEPGAHVIGFGERFDRLDQRGHRLDATVFEPYKRQGNRTYLPVPFGIVIPGDGSPAWGFHVRTSRRTWYDVGATDSDRLWIEVALDPDTAEPRVAIATYTGSPAEVLAAFTAETGRPALPPDWVFRLWMSANEWNTEARVRAEVERSLAEGITVGAVVVEAWSDETTFAAFRGAQYTVHPDGAPHRLADFTFPADGPWPDPKGLVDWLHARDIRILLWQIPLIRAHPAPVGQAKADSDTMAARGYGVRQAGGHPYRNRGWWFPGAMLPDWTNPQAKAWWLAKRRYLVQEIGIDGFKTDGGEHAWGDDLRYADDSRGEAGNNRYPVLYAAAYHELMASLGRAPVTFSRSGFTGAGAFPCHWAGDEDSTWEAFRASITAGLSAGASGVVLWGWDLAGFSGEIPDAELYLRAVAMAAFCPIMQYHSEFNHHRLPSRDRSPWNIAERTGDPRVLPVFRRFARLRERLVPYLAEQARRSIETGRPLMRALAFEWPDDPASWDHPYEYLLGDDLLVAPVVEPGTDRRTVYLPAGDWVDVWTDERIEGGGVVERDTPLHAIPVYSRGEPALAEELRRELTSVAIPG